MKLLGSHASGSGTGPRALGWEINMQFVSGAQGNGAFNGVLQLANIARPIVAGE